MSWSHPSRRPGAPKWPCCWFGPLSSAENPYARKAAWGVPGMTSAKTRILGTQNDPKIQNPKNAFLISRLILWYAFPSLAKKGNIGIGGIGQDTRECLVHFCDKDCPVTPECPRFEEKKNLDYWQCPNKILACDVATSPGDFANLSIHFCCLKSTPHESFLHPRTHPKNAGWPVEIPSVQANFMQWNSICMNLPT